MNSVHFSTGKDDWGTPQDLFDALNEEFNFTLDPCADNNNHKCAKYYTIEQDGLAQSWAGETVFCNPPYSRKTKTNAGQIAWVQKCYKEATEGGIVVVMLIPARTNGMQDIGERRRLRQDLQERCGITELEAINIINGFHIDTYCIKYLRKAREAAEGTPEPTKKKRRR